MRLIDADEALEEIEGLRIEFDEKYSEYAEGWKDAVNDASAIIYACPTVPAFAQWISCKDHLPEDNRIVLGCNIDGIYIVYLDNGKWKHEGGFECFPNPLYWIPIPDEPKKEENQ